MQWDDPLDAIAVHAWNGTWGVIAVGAFADADLITNSYGTDVFSGGQRALRVPVPWRRRSPARRPDCIRPLHCRYVAARFSYCCCLAWLRLADL